MRALRGCVRGSKGDTGGAGFCCRAAQLDTWRGDAPGGLATPHQTAARSASHTRSRRRGERGSNLAPLTAIITPFSNQTRVPAEFKHITKRRKRN